MYFLAFEPLASFFPASPPRPAPCFGHGPAGPDPILSLCLQPEQGQRQVLLSRIWPWVKLRFHLALLWLLVPCPWKRAALAALGTAWPCWVGRGGYRRGASTPCNTPLHLNMCTAFPLTALQPGCEWSAFSGRRLLGALLPPLALVTAHRNTQGICQGSPSRSFRTRESSLCSPRAPRAPPTRTSGMGLGAAGLLGCCCGDGGSEPGPGQCVPRCPNSAPSAARTQQKDRQSLMPHSTPRASRALALCCLS